MNKELLRLLFYNIFSIEKEIDNLNEERRKPVPILEVDTIYERIDTSLKYCKIRLLEHEKILDTYLNQFK